MSNPPTTQNAVDNTTESIAALQSLLESGSLLTRTQLSSLGKKDILEYHFRHDSLVTALDSIATNFKAVTDRLNRAEASVATLRSSNDKLAEHCKSLASRLDDVERQATNNAQYLRRRQLEVKNIGPVTNSAALKRSMADLLSLTGEVVSPNDFDKCHTLGKGVIMEFKTREKRDAILRGRKNFKSKAAELKSMKMEKPMVLESLCKQYGQLDFICRSLSRSNSIEKTWFFNGRLHIDVDGETHHQISHITDLYEIFGMASIQALIRK